MSSYLLRVLGGGTIAAASMFVLTGCSSYYRVTDPTTGRTFYTQSVDEKGGGAVKFKDSRNDADVTLQNSHVQKLNEKEYDEGMRMQAATTAQKNSTDMPTTMPAR
jgi:hypothetical protein